MNWRIVYLWRNFKMKSNKLSNSEILKLKTNYYNNEQLLKHTKFLENGIKEIDKIIHKSNIDKNWYAIQEIVEELMEHI